MRVRPNLEVNRKRRCYLLKLPHKLTVRIRISLNAYYKILWIAKYIPTELWPDSFRGGQIITCVYFLTIRMMSLFEQAGLVSHSWYLVFDDHDAYKAVAKENNRIINAGCWNHVRRRFEELYRASGEPRVDFVLKVLARTFSLEERIRLRSPENKVRWRRQYFKPQLDKLHGWLTEQLNVCQPGSVLYKAIVH